MRRRAAPSFGSKAAPVDEELEDLDWWSKYYASVRAERDDKRDAAHDDDDQDDDDDEDNIVERIADKLPDSPIKSLEHSVDLGFLNEGFEDDESDADVDAVSVRQRLCRLKIFKSELEKQPEFGAFQDLVRAFDLRKGKGDADDDDDASRVCGVFKGNFKLYRIPEELVGWGEGPDGASTTSALSKTGPFVLRPGENLPVNDPRRVVAFVYVLRAVGLHAADSSGKCDAYPVVRLGPDTRDDSEKDDYVPKSNNPIFGRRFRFEASLPREAKLTVQIFDRNSMVESDRLVGETTLDLEARRFTRHRASCGLARKFDLTGYNAWRDAELPSEILARMCDSLGIVPPVFTAGTLKIGLFSVDSSALFPLYGAERPQHLEEDRLALEALHSWSDERLGGFQLVPEHVESRPLYLPSKPGIERGRLEMWVDTFDADLGPPPPPVDVKPRKPKSYELRCVVLKTEEVELTDSNFATGEQSADIYVKGWVIEDDVQSTDVHFASLTGEGDFNWRFKFRFDYSEAEERVVVKRKASVFDLDETEFKTPPRLVLQVWDLDVLTDDFVGSVSLDLKRLPRPARSARRCGPEILDGEDAAFVNLFKTRRARGWWPFMAPVVGSAPRTGADSVPGTESAPETPTAPSANENGARRRLVGKIEAEIHLLDLDEAERGPVGLRREAPEPLEKPVRPDISYAWCISPLRSCVKVFWPRFKVQIIVGVIVFLLAFFLFLFVYHLPRSLATRAVLGNQVG